MDFPTVPANAVDSVVVEEEETAASVEAVVSEAELVVKCSTLFAPSVARRLRSPSSRAVRVRSIAGIASRLTARHVVVVAAAVASATAVDAATAVPVATSRI